MDNIWNSGRDNTKIMIGIDNSGFNFGKGKEIFFFSKASRLSLAPNGPPIQRIPRVFFLELKRQRLEVEALTPPTDVEVKN